APFLVPQILRPDREGWTWKDFSWSLKPKEPRIKGKVVFVNHPGVVSAGETAMAIIDHYELATLVGATTAGCNGNVTFIPVPAGGRIMWTGMVVKKHDGSPLYLRGYEPDRPVERTMEEIMAGRDEAVPVAIAVIEETTGD